MQLEDYLEFKKEPVEHIRVKGTRIGLEHVIELHKSHMTPEQIHAHYGMWPPLESIYAVIAYYLRNKEEVEAYIERGEKIAEAYYQEYLKKPMSPVMKRLLELKRLLALETQGDQETYGEFINRVKSKMADEPTFVRSE